MARMRQEPVKSKAAGAGNVKTTGVCCPDVGADCCQRGCRCGGGVVGVGVGVGEGVERHIRELHAARSRN